MKVIKKTKSYSKIRMCYSFWTWLFFDTDFPFIPADDPQWYKHMGSPHRVHITRIFGHKTETEYIDTSA
jgi:hypothetical protein